LFCGRSFYIAVAYGRQNKEQEASEYLIDAKKYSEDCSAFHHAIYGYLIQSNKEDAETLYQGLKKSPIGQKLDFAIPIYAKVS
jgi:hypothetical protein